jgi:hypothetical protein
MARASWTAAFAVLLSASLAAADVAPFLRGGPPGPSNAVRVLIEVGGPGETEARMIVPRHLLPRAAQVARAERAPGQSLFAASALLCGVGAIGVCLRRRSSLRALALVLALVGGVALAGRSALRATPPSRPAVLALVQELNVGAVQVEITEEGNEIRLLLPRSKVGELARALRARP